MTRVVAIILARAGSKRLIGKNKKLFYGKPLFLWSLEQALQCNFIDDVIISTDDEDIIDICRNINNEKLVISKRPKELAQDDTHSLDVILHELRHYPLDTIVILLQPTSPLREIQDIESVYDVFIQHFHIPTLSVYREDDFHFKLNGVIYIFNLRELILGGYDLFKQKFHLFYLMPKERSVDIDTIEDWNLAEKLMKERLNKDINEDNDEC